ncbi:MAG: ion transporter, partial [Promethearchaeia archaeon]
MFLHSGFNLMDLSIVTVSWISMTLPDVKNVSVLRMFRVARIVRIARRMTSLITLARSVAGAVFPILNTFLVILMISGLY